ncbi:hypothetical protein, partial [Brucella endophytica]|uniref:hypothetical protein n=1 Tax=Brucella endophytica TaxID=1963359 RepID=UPI0035BC487C
ETRKHSAAHVSLSSIFNCQRTDTIIVASKQEPDRTAETPEPNPGTSEPFRTAPSSGGALCSASFPLSTLFFRANRPFKLSPPGQILQSFQTFTAKQETSFSSYHQSEAISRQWRRRRRCVAI